MQTIKLWSIHWAKFKQYVHYYFLIIRSWPAIISLLCACEHVMFSTNCSSPSSGCPIKAQDPITGSASTRSGQTSFRPSALTPPLIGRSISIQVQHLNKAMAASTVFVSANVMSLSAWTNWLDIWLRATSCHSQSVCHPVARLPSLLHAENTIRYQSRQNRQSQLSIPIPNILVPGT